MRRTPALPMAFSSIPLPRRIWLLGHQPDGGLDWPPCWLANRSGWIWAYWDALGVKEEAVGEALGW